MAWTQEQKDKLVADYLASEPTAETSAEICKELAEELEQTANGVRMILIAAGVYVKKEPAKAADKATTGTKAAPEAGKRMSKEAQIKELSNLITTRGLKLDTEILDKLTGKAAAYFVDLLSS